MWTYDDDALRNDVQETPAAITSGPAVMKFRTPNHLIVCERHTRVDVTITGTGRYETSARSEL